MGFYRKIHSRVWGFTDYPFLVIVFLISAAGVAVYFIVKKVDLGVRREQQVVHEQRSVNPKSIQSVSVSSSTSPLVSETPATSVPLPLSPTSVSTSTTGVPDPTPFALTPILDKTDLRLTLPVGYTISYFTKKSLGPLRFMAFSPDGILFVTKPTNASAYSDPLEGEVLAFLDANKDGVADEVKKVLTGLTTRPHGVAFYNGFMYIAGEREVSRYQYLNGGKVGAREHVVDLPSDGGHVTRTIGFSPAGKMYISVGSSCNICIESRKENAVILEFNLDGSGQNVFAEGLRNAVGLTFHPVTGEMWATDNGRDYLGDDLPPEEINIVRKGKHYGWPYCYGKNKIDSEYANSGFCTVTVPNLWNMQAHSAPLGLRFISGPQFAEWEGDLLVAFHGSWNRNIPTGYKIVRLDVKGNAVIKEEDFISGWFRDGSVSGRPVDIIFGPDGALYISDDKLGVVYRVAKN